MNDQPYGLRELAWLCSSLSSLGRPWTMIRQAIYWPSDDSFSIGIIDWGTVSRTTNESVDILQQLGQADRFWTLAENMGLATEGSDHQ